MSTLYATLNPDKVRAIIEQRVYSGDMIGVVDNSGNKDKPPFHLEVDIMEDRIDPMTIMGEEKKMRNFI